jgi:hypothetical protein
LKAEVPLPANTAGVNGTGTIMGIVIKGLSPGASTLSIVQVSAKDSQQRPIQLVTSEANCASGTLKVAPDFARGMFCKKIDAIRYEMSAFCGDKLFTRFSGIF